MASAKMTLIGMMQWDEHLFDSLVLPDGIDKDLFINSLLMQGGEFEVLYPNPAIMKTSIGIWSTKWFRTFKEWLKGTHAEWNPIYNYDRYEVAQDDGRKKFDSKTTADYSDKRTANLSEDHKTDYDDTRTTDLTDKRTANLTDERVTDLTDKRTANLKDEKTVDLTDKRSADLTDKNTFNNSDITEQIDNSTTEHEIAAYDSATYQPSSKDTIDNGTSSLKHSGTVTTDHTGTDSTARTGTDTDKHTGTDTTDHTGTEKTKQTGTDTTDHTGTDKMKHTGADNITTKGTDTMDHVGTLADVGGHEENRNLHSAHMYGNIGVTTSAAMLREFYDIAKWSLYEHMCDVFISELLIAVY